MGVDLNRKVKAASLSVLSNTTLLTLKLVIGLVTGSVSVLSAAADSLNDLTASGIAFFSVRASEKPADIEHPYGHGKIENVSGLIQAGLIFIAAIYIIYEAVGKILEPRPVEAIGLAMVIMAITSVLDLFVSRYLLKVANETDSPAIRADAFHLTTDVWTSIGVFVGLILVHFTGAQIIDPIVALGVAAMIIYVAVHLTLEAMGVLLDVRLPRDEVAKLAEVVMQTPKIVGYHRLRTRKSGSCREIDFHLILPSHLSLVEGHKIAEELEQRIADTLPNTTVVIHVEPDTVDIVSVPDTELKKRPLTRRSRRAHRNRRFA